MFKLKNENVSSTGAKLKFNFSPVLRAISIIPNQPPPFNDISPLFNTAL
ncbi:MAG: hypothetical protein JNL69_09025 [Bacteroidia bacterium]|nr:hypothetical protein [Bacteroidia bacterium]